MGCRRLDHSLLACKRQWLGVDEEFLARVYALDEQVVLRAQFYSDCVSNLSVNALIPCFVCEDRIMQEPWSCGDS